MSEQEKQEGQKTVISFISGLLIGGLLVWAFSGTPNDDATTTTMTETEMTETATPTGDTATEDTTPTDTTTTDTTPTMTVGDGELVVADQAAGSAVTLESAVFPTDEGWVAVRTYTDGQLGNILGAARYSKEQGLVPTEVPLLAPTVSGRDYAVVFFSEDGNRVFNLDGDVQIDTGMTTFTAN